MEIAGATGLSRLRRGCFSKGMLFSLTPCSAFTAPTTGTPCVWGWTQRTLSRYLMGEKKKKSEFKVLKLL